jgi:nitrite reductase/ring-hydroxylating ferredoxin subunit
MSPISRREFMNLLNKGLIATGTAAVLGPILAYFYPGNLQETPSEPVLVCKVDELPIGESKTISYGRYPALVINTTQGLRAYSAVCTHFACIVKWDTEKGSIYCPCHDGYFDPMDGQVTAGPPPIGLTAIPVNVVNKEIYIGGSS